MKRSISLLFFCCIIYFRGWAQVQQPINSATPATTPIAKPAVAVPLNANTGEMKPLTIPSNNSVGSIDSSNAIAIQGLSQRDPFKLPEYLIIKLRQKMALAASSGTDESIEPIRRWPLGSYQLVGIIWDVKKPKVMFLDRLNSIHMLHVNDFIGNAKGVITSIQSGSVTVLEGKIPQIIKLKK